MVRDGSVVPTQGCPGRDDLDDFVRGRLPPEKREAIAEHLCQCARCESSLDALHADETVLNHLRREPAHVFLLNDPVCEQLEERARAIPREHLGTPTVSDVEPEKTVSGVVEGPPLPIAFGAYLLLERLGQGGMGIVYKSRQETLKRLVALKMVRAGIYASPEERARFQREGESVARVQHANVVQIHEFGEHQGQLFFSMELLEGGTLTSKLNRQPLPEREAAEMVRTLARAVHAAHQQGVVHRDLKPGNVLFAVDGTVKITDFGLAKMLDAEDSDTRSDAILGTPAYMAPEQARGESRTIGPTADVYALGAILYETLTGRPPFVAETRLQTLELVRAGEPEAPSRHRRELSRDLEAICLKCLEKEPTQRYASAEALAGDLERWLDGAATQARPLRWHNRIHRLVRRHRWAVAGVGLLFLLAGVVLATFYFRDPQRKAEDIEAGLRRGAEVTLIGDKGDPVWYRWGLRRGPADLSHEKDGAFSVRALDPAVLTLLADPRGSYRFSAEVRHDYTTRLGQVGICFAHSQHATPHGMQHCLCTLIFNDWESIYRDPATGKMAARVRFIVRRAAESGSMGTGEIILKHFIPAAVESSATSPWRSLAVQVRPEGIDLFWEAERVAQVSHQRILEKFEPLKRVRVENRMVDQFPDLHPAFSPQDALGLFVTKGGASFRRVRVEPLPQP